MEADKNKQLCILIVSLKQSSPKVKDHIQTQNLYSVRNTNMILQGNSPQAMSLARGIQDKLRELQDKVNTAVVNTDKSGIRKPAHTMSGKAQQAQRWLADPARDDRGLGML